MSNGQDTPRWFRTVMMVCDQVEVGSFTFRLPNGVEHRAQGATPGPNGVIEVKNLDLFGRMIRDGDLGFAEAYMDGWWDTPDLQAVLDCALINNDKVGRGFPGAGLVKAFERFRHWMNSNTKRGSRRNISHHYDLGNEFYGAWLDETMTYSSALFTAEDEPMAAGQRNKYASICDRMGLQPDNHVLEIGCGWGGFAEYAAMDRGAKVTGLTISREQHDFARKRVFEKGLAERVDIVMRDYRDERGAYDGIASIEMFEAVGERYWPVYFETVRERLKPGASASIQIITIADDLFDSYRSSVDFVQKYIFPGGMLPSPSALQRETGKAGLVWDGAIEFGQSYSSTLRRWHTDFNAKWHEISELGFDDRFRRMWNFYLTVCAACFRAETTNVTQVALRRPG